MKMAINILDISIKGNNMDLVNTHGLMEVNMRDFSKLESILVTVNILIQVALDILENTKKGFKMELV